MRRIPLPASPRVTHASRALLALGTALALLVWAPACSRPRGEAFPVAAYLDAPDKLEGNRYAFDAEIDTQLEWREGVGRLVAVKPLASAAEASARIPVFIADSLQTNLMPAQRYRLELTVRRGGLLYVSSLRKL